MMMLPIVASLLLCGTNVVLAIPGKSEIFHQVDSTSGNWTWVGRISDRYQFNAKSQRALFNRQLSSFSHSIPKAPKMISMEDPVTILIPDVRGFEDIIASSDLQKCSVPCRVTTNRTELASCHIVMTAGQDIPEEFLQMKDWQQRALFDLEPDLSLPDVDSRVNPFNMLVSYSRHSDVRIDYTRSLIIPKTELPDLTKKNKTRLAAAFFNNCDANGDARYRLDYLQALSIFLEIDFYGSCLHTPGLPKDAKFADIVDKYYYALVFENSILDDYVTDKFYEALGSNAIPVYMGAPNIKDYLPVRNNKKIIIEAREFPDPASLADHLKKLAEDPVAYWEYFYWRGDEIERAFSKRFDFTRRGEHSATCRMCKYYNDRVEK